MVHSERVQTPQAAPGLEQQQDRDQDPDSIKEDQVDPQVEPGGRVQVRAAEQPVGTEGHPAAVQLAHAQSNLQEVSDRRVNISADQYLCISTCTVLPVVLVLQYCVYQQQSQHRGEDDG